MRDRLDWLSGIIEGSGWPKPKNTRRRTFDRLVAEYESRETQALGVTMVWLRSL